VIQLFNVPVSFQYLVLCTFFGINVESDLLFIDCAEQAVPLSSQNILSANLQVSDLVTKVVGIRLDALAVL